MRKEAESIKTRKQLREDNKLPRKKTHTTEGEKDEHQMAGKGIWTFRKP